MRAFVLGLVAGYGTFLLYTAVAFGWQGLGLGPGPMASKPRRLLRLPSARAAGRPVAAFALGGAAGFVLFGGMLPPVAVGMFAAGAPGAATRRRREHGRAAAREAWPAVVEDIRTRIGASGRSLPQALFEAGRYAPDFMRDAFADAERHWLVTTDFARTVALLKERLADATADAVLETLLVAHDIGGPGIDGRLAALVDDRLQDMRGRREAEAKQAGVRFARRFVLLVPLGMALAGLSIGTGRAAYATPTGQAAVAAGIAMVAACWAWAGRLLQLPVPERVLAGDAGRGAS